jgi:hypothetical protein
MDSDKPGRNCDDIRPAHERSDRIAGLLPEQCDAAEHGLQQPADDKRRVLGRDGAGRFADATDPRSHRAAGRFMRFGAADDRRLPDAHLHLRDVDDCDGDEPVAVGRLPGPAQVDQLHRLRRHKLGDEHGHGGELPVRLQRAPPRPVRPAPLDAARNHL